MKDRFIFISGKGQSAVLCILNLIITLVLSYFFYDNLYLLILFPLINHFFLKYEKRLLHDRQKNILLLQFKEMLSSVDASLKAGFSLENAVKHSLSDIENFFGKKAVICFELRNIINNMNLNTPIELCFKEFADRTGIKHIEDFATVLIIAKKTSGNAASVTSSSIDMIKSSIDAKKEINSLTAAKRFEKNIMFVMPLFIIIYMNLTSPGFLDPLYRTLAGKILMTACLGIYVISAIFSEKLLKL